MKKTNLTLVLFLLFLAGCGVKPGQIAPPDGSKDSGFPHTYPSAKTDPAPSFGNGRLTP